jgi:hypothetical protein
MIIIMMIMMIYGEYDDIIMMIFSGMTITWGI